MKRRKKTTNKQTKDKSKKGCWEEKREKRRKTEKEKNAPRLQRKEEKKKRTEKSALNCHTKNDTTASYNAPLQTANHERKPTEGTRTL